jgi:uncharacterized membrane protein
MFQRVLLLKRTGIILGFMIILYSMLASAFSILRYEALLTQATDLGIFMQALYSTLHGRLLYEAVDYQAYGATSFLGVHFSPIILVIVPFYWLFPYAETLLVLQAVVVASGAIPTYLIAKRAGSEKRAFAFSSFYLLYAPLLGANLYDFHVESFLPVFLLFTFYFTESRRYARALIPIMLSLATTEASPPLIAFMMLYFIIGERRKWKSRKWEILLLIVMVPVYLLERYVMGFFAPGQGALVGLNQISPLYLLSDFPLKVGYFFVILAAAGFLPLLSLPTAIMALPWIATQLFSSQGFPHSVGWQYDFFLIPWILVGSIQSVNGTGKSWFTRMFKRGVRPPMLFRGGVLVSLIISPVIPFAGLAIGPLFGGQGYVVSYSPSPQFPEVKSLVQEIGPGPVLVSDHLFPYLANSLDAYDFEPNVPILGTTTRVPTVQHILIQESDVASLPPGFIDAFYPRSSVGVGNSTIFLYERRTGL